MRERLPAVLAVLTALSVGYRAVSGFLGRHDSQEWEFARGHWFLYSYDAAYTYAPVLALAIVGWGFRRRSRALIIYGLGLLLVALIGPLVTWHWVFPEHPVWSLWLADPTFVSATGLALLALLATGLDTRRPERATD